MIPDNGRGGRDCRYMGSARYRIFRETFKPNQIWYPIHTLFFIHRLYILPTLLQYICPGLICRLFSRLWARASSPATYKCSICCQVPGYTFFITDNWKTRHELSTHVADFWRSWVTLLYPAGRHFNHTISLSISWEVIVKKSCRFDTLRVSEIYLDMYIVSRILGRGFVMRPN